jgi:RimJ/RimL family protein N-acetyltransferase
VNAIPTLTTPRLALRPPGAADLEHFVALGADPEVMRYIAGGKTQTSDEAAAWLDRILRAAREGFPGLPGLPGCRVVTTKGDNAWAGLAFLIPMNPRHADAIEGGPYVEIGYRLARACWGKGYATEAAAALVRYGFVNLNLPLITAIAQTRNVSSNRVIQKIGLVQRKTYSLDGIDICFHSLARGEYRPVSGSSPPA